MKEYKKSKLFQFLFPFLFIVGIGLIILGFNNYKTVSLKYEEDNYIKYNVFLKKNSFFDTPFLGEGRTYIASLIDYIGVNFHYDINYDKPVDGNYKYKYVALVRANKKESDGYYWEKEYDLSEEKTLEIKNDTNVSIDDNLKVQYGLYNDILNKFKKEYGVNTNGELKVIMKITGVTNFDGINNPVNRESMLSLSIPLLEQSLEVSIDKDASNDKNVVSVKEKDDNIIYIVFKILGVVFMILAVVGFIRSTKNAKKYKNDNKYELSLEKILKNYDSIIANANSMPNINGFKKIEISTFEELLDVYNEVRMPINYYQKNDKSTFIIINEGVAWVYSLKNGTDNNESK